MRSVRKPERFGSNSMWFMDQQLPFSPSAALSYCLDWFDMILVRLLQVKEILEVCQDLTEEEAECALKLHGYK